MNNNNQRSAFGAYQNPQQLQSTQQGFQTTQQGIQNAQQGFQTTQGLQNTQQGFQQGGFQTQGYLPQHVEKVNLPTRVVELPTAIHEQVRVEKVKEVQPIVNVERDFTQVIQKTQPIIDKEIRPVNIHERNLETQVLPDIRKIGKENAVPRDFDTVQYMQPRALTVEKPTIYNEVDKTQVIEEIQPVIYKETIVPQITKETAPSFQKIVEGTVYSNERLSTVDLGVKGQNYVADRTVPSGVTVTERLPTQRVNVPTAVHEKIRQERVTEIQPVVNVERDFTQVIQKTQPLLDKEIRPVQIEERTLPTNMLPDVNRETGLGGMPRETSSVDYLQEKRSVIQKPTIYNEIDKTKIIEEIQPVIYKETIVPEVVKETQPSFQRIVEGTTYTSQVLPPVQLHGSNFSYPTQVLREINPPVVTTQPVVIVEEKVVTKQMPLPPKPKKKAPQTRKIIEEKETYVTTVNEIIPNMKKI